MLLIQLDLLIQTTGGCLDSFKFLLHFFELLRSEYVLICELHLFHLFGDQLLVVRGEGEQTVAQLLEVGLGGFP